MQQILDLARSLDWTQWAGIALIAWAAWMSRGKLVSGFSWLRSKTTTTTTTTPDTAFDDSFKALDVIAAAHKDSDEVKGLIGQLADAITRHHYPRSQVAFTIGRPPPPPPPEATAWQFTPTGPAPSGQTATTGGGQ